MRETRKIRIGNDVRLAVDLRQYIGGDYLREREVYNPEALDFENIDSNPYVNRAYEVYYGENFNGYSNSEESTGEFIPTSHAVCIRSIKALLINTTVEKYRNEELRKKEKFIHRFPIEPYIKSFHSTPYDICNSGYYSWKAYPYRIYGGFGVYPQFDGLCKHLSPIDDTQYVANVMATSKQNIVEVDFPAEDQLHVGKYTLIIVAKLYAPGYNKHNLKTVTIDVPDVFELVKTSEEGVDTNYRIIVNRYEDNLPNPDEDVVRDIYVNSGSIDIQENGLNLGLTNGQTVNVDLNSALGWYDSDDQDIIEGDVYTNEGD